MTVPSKTERLIQQYRSYASILQDRGLEFEPLSDEDLATISYRELNAIVREVRDLARTPS